MRVSTFVCVVLMLDFGVCSGVSVLGDRPVKMGSTSGGIGFDGLPLAHRGFLKHEEGYRETPIEISRCVVVLCEVAGKEMNMGLWPFSGRILLSFSADGDGRGNGWLLQDGGGGTGDRAGWDGNRRNGGSEPAEKFRFVVVKELGSKVFVFSRQTTDGLEVLRFRDIADDHVQLTTRQIGTSVHGYESIPHVTDMIRSCQYCFARGTICECSPTMRRRYAHAVKDNGGQEQADRQITAYSVNNQLATWTDGYWGLRQRNTMFPPIQMVTTRSTMDERVLSDCIKCIQDKYSHIIPPTVGLENERNNNPISGPKPIESLNSSGGGAGAGGVHSCPQCPKAFSRAYYLRRHFNSVHVGWKPHVCSFCGKNFSQKGHLNEHTRGQHSNNTVKCDREGCMSQFGSQSKLTRHIRAVHDNVRLHDCEFCGKAFKEKSHLIKHYRSHQKKDPTETSELPRLPIHPHQHQQHHHHHHDDVHNFSLH